MPRKLGTAGDETSSRYGSLVPRLKVEDEIRFDCILFGGLSASGKLAQVWEREQLV